MRVVTFPKESMVAQRRNGSASEVDESQRLGWSLALVMIPAYVESFNNLVHDYHAAIKFGNNVGRRG